MGGRGASSGASSRSGLTPPQNITIKVGGKPVKVKVQFGPVSAAPNQAPQQTQTQQPTQPQNPTPAQASNWIPPGQFNYTPQQLANLNDSQAEALLKAAYNVDMPNHLKDAPDGTQDLVYALGMNTPPTILDSTQFSQFMKQNNIPQSQVMSRQVGAGTYNTTSGSRNRLSDAQIAQMWLSDPYNYIGGKHGGQAYGAGAYFDMNGGGRTGYGSGSTTLYTGVLNPKTARVITDGALNRKASQWKQTHPKADAMLKKLANKGNGWGNGDLSLYAIMLGYNVIKASHGGYHNVIDRSAMVIKQ